MKHINALNLAARFAERLKGTGLSPSDIALLRIQFQRAKHRAERLNRYFQRNKGYPYSSKRQCGLPASSSGITTYTPRPINPAHWSGRTFGGPHA